MKLLRMIGVELIYPICVLVVFTGSIRKALPDQDIIQGRFHRTLGKERLHLSAYVMRCSVKCTHDTNCRSFVIRPWPKLCILGSVSDMFIALKDNIYQKVSGYCPTEMNYVWSEDAELCFRFETHKKKNWNDAETTCNLEGGHLIKLDNPIKIDFIMKAASKTKNDDKRAAYYIGLRQLKTNDGWRWYDNTPVFISGWERDEPNGDGICCHIRKNDPFKWTDSLCDYKWYYICEIVI